MEVQDEISYLSMEGVDHDHETQGMKLLFY